MKNTFTSRGGQWVVILLVGSLAIVGCSSDDRVIEPTPVSSIKQAVVGVAADRLDPDGHFMLDGPLDLPYPQITADRAIALADAFRSGPLASFVPLLERDRGSGIKASALKNCGRTYYAEPAIGAIPSSVHPAIRRAHGPHWILNYCGESGLPEVALAVSAYATDLKIENGMLVYPLLYGGEYFHPIGIPKNRRESLPGSPEAAAAEAAAVSGVRVASVPRLVTLPRMAPALSFWQFELEHSATLRGRTSKRDTSTAKIYFTDDSRWGHRGRWISQIGGPTEFEYTWPVPSEKAGVPATFLKGRVTARPGFSIRIEPVEEAYR